MAELLSCWPHQELPEGTSGSPPAAEPAPADVPADVTATGEEVTGEAEQEAAEAEAGKWVGHAVRNQERVLEMEAVLEFLLFSFTLGGLPTPNQFLYWEFQPQAV